MQILGGQNVTTKLPETSTHMENDESTDTETRARIKETIPPPTNISSVASEAADNRVIAERTVLEFFALQHG